MAALGLHCCAWSFSTGGEQGLLFAAVHRFLIAVASFVEEHRLRRSGSIVVAHKLSCPTAHGVFPNQELNLHLLHCRRVLYHCTTADALLVFLRSVKASFSFKTHLTGGISGLPPSPCSAVYMCIRASFDCTQCLGRIHCPQNTVAIHVPPVGRWLLPDSARTKGCLHTYLSFPQLIHQLVFLKHLLIMCKALGLDKRFFKSFCLVQQLFLFLSVVIYYENTKDVRDMASNLKRHSTRFPPGASDAGDIGSIPGQETKIPGAM